MNNKTSKWSYLTHTRNSNSRSVLLLTNQRSMKVTYQILDLQKR